MKYIILTHGHFDHTYHVKSLKEKTGAKLCLHEDELELYQNPMLNGSRMFGAGRGFETSAPDILLKDGQKLQAADLNLEIIHTPGHSPGSICILSGSTLFTGDTLFAMSIGRTDFPGGSHKAMTESLRSFSRWMTALRYIPGMAPRPPSAMKRSTTPMPDGRLYVIIRGIDMAYDAKVLLGLFYDRNKIIITEGNDLPAPEPGSMLITLEKKEYGGGFTAEAAFYDDVNGPDDILAILDGSRKPSHNSLMRITDYDMNRPGGTLMRRKKVTCGTVLYNVLKEVFNKELLWVPYGVRPVKMATICLEDGMDEGKRLIFRQITESAARRPACCMRWPARRKATWTVTTRR